MPLYTEMDVYSESHWGWLRLLVQNDNYAIENVNGEEERCEG